MAIESGAYIVPFVVAPVDTVIDRRTWNWKGGDLHCKVLEPISCKGKSLAEVQDLMESTQELMQRELDQIIDQFYPSFRAERGMPLSSANGRGSGLGGSGKIKTR